MALFTLFGAPQDALPRVVLSTSPGDIILEIDTRSAPATAANFLRHLDAELYDQGRFHRTVRPDNQPASPIRIEVVQAMAPEIKTSLPILLERTSVTGLHHQNSTLSMAREKPDSASHQFFICLGDQPELDFARRRNPDGQGFSAFGRVVSVHDVARRIQSAPVEGQRLSPPIALIRARRLVHKIAPKATATGTSRNISITAKTTSSCHPIPLN